MYSTYCGNLLFFRHFFTEIFHKIQKGAKSPHKISVVGKSNFPTFLLSYRKNFHNTKRQDDLFFVLPFCYVYSYSSACFIRLIALTRARIDAVMMSVSMPAPQ